MTCFVYMIRCKDGSLYTGWTNNLEERVKKHLAGKAAKYTTAKVAIALAYAEQLDNKSVALRRECAIKKLSKATKEKMAKKWQEKEII